MKEVKIGNNFYSLPWKLNNLIKQDRLNTLWPLLFDTKQDDKKKNKKSKTI